jgi:hypothetical protein
MRAYYVYRTNLAFFEFLVQVELVVVDPLFDDRVDFPV